MNETCIWKYIFLGEVGGEGEEGGVNDVDTILGGVNIYQTKKIQ